MAERVLARLPKKVLTLPQLVAAMDQDASGLVSYTCIYRYRYIDIEIKEGAHAIRARRSNDASGLVSTVYV
jgi:hypothetical protein